MATSILALFNLYPRIPTPYSALPHSLPDPDPFLCSSSSATPLATFLACCFSSSYHFFFSDLPASPSFSPPSSLPLISTSPLPAPSPPPSAAAASPLHGPSLPFYSTCSIYFAHDQTIILPSLSVFFIPLPSYSFFPLVFPLKFRVCKVVFVIHSSEVPFT